MAIPPNVAVERGAPAMTFAGTDRTMFCGGQDLTPERDGHPAMHWTSEWVERFGGVTSTFTQDPGAGHGGFHQDPLHIRAALEPFRDNLALRRGSPRPSAR